MIDNNEYKLTVPRYILAPFNKLENQERLLKEDSSRQATSI